MPQVHEADRMGRGFRTGYGETSEAGLEELMVYRPKNQTKSSTAMRTKVDRRDQLDRNLLLMQLLKRG